MPYGLPICGACGSTTGIEAHHLYLRSDGCPDDLTVWLCHVCHGRAHEMRRRVNIVHATRNGVAKAKKRGVAFGRPLALDASQRLKIAERHAAGETMLEIGRSYGVSEATIWRTQQPSRTRFRLYSAQNRGERSCIGQFSTIGEALRHVRRCQ